jgi:hypothetical protein
MYKAARFLETEKLFAGFTKSGNFKINKGRFIVRNSLSLYACGERGIRTPGGITLNGFQDRRNRPLCHLSAAKLKNYVESKTSGNNIRVRITNHQQVELIIILKICTFVGDKHQLIFVVTCSMAIIKMTLGS